MANIIPQGGRKIDIGPKADLNESDKVEAAQASAMIVSVLSSKTLGLSDAGTMQQVSSSSARTITIPANASVAFPVGTEIEIVRYGTGSVTVTAAGGVTLVSANSLVSLSSQYACAALKKLTADTWLLTGALS